MEQTMGKRISANRKRLGLTQDQMAERLGVTAQAVSKWENDQSCPDIAMVPRIAALFGITTDELLGVEKQAQPEPVVLEPMPRENDGTWEMNWDGGKKSSVGLAVWVILCGALLFVSNMLGWRASLWDILWPTGLIVFGAWGVVSVSEKKLKKFSFFRLGCILLGAYFLPQNLNLVTIYWNRNLIFPLCLLIFGLSLLADAIRKPRHKGSFHVTHNGKTIKTKGEFQTEGEGFFCSTSFTENRRQVVLPRLSHGSASVSFGELVVDMTDCGEIADGCVIEAEASFGELVLILPRSCRIQDEISTAFGNWDIRGSSDAGAQTAVVVRGSVNFGQMTVKLV